MTNDDIVEIHQVMGLYAHVIDGKQWHRLDELYTDDGVFDLSGLLGSPMRFEGIDAIKGFLTSMPMPLAHIGTNSYVFEEDGVVQSRAKWFMPTDEGTISGGVYRDVWSKTDRGWRLKERQVFNWSGAEE
jgi:SnoaL-like domain